MAPKMGISKIFKGVEYTRRYVDSEYEEIFFIASLGVELLALEDEFQRQSLEFIVRSILVRFS